MSEQSTQGEQQHFLNPLNAAEYQDKNENKEVTEALAPEFLSNVMRLQELAVDGIETPRGKEAFDFRVGIETEFVLTTPQKFRTAIMEDLQISDGLKGDHYDMIQNKELIGSDYVEDEQTIDNFRIRAAEFVATLVPTDVEQEAKKQEWLSQIPSFGVREMINFELYERFSKPTLGDTATRAEATLSDLDAEAEQNGWLEFRFGNGGFQTGYYDNPGMCELRMTPCAPEEAIKRDEIITGELADISSKYGMLLQTGPDRQHINLSVYRREDGDGVPLISHNDDDRPAVMDITAGIAAGFQEGLWINKKNMKWEYVYSKYGGGDLEFAPTRKTVRILDGRIELRSFISQPDQAINWLMAGSIYGLERGADAIKASGYDTPNVTEIFEVKRAEGFGKQKDLHIQRAFENCEEVDGKLDLNIGFIFVRGEQIGQSLFGQDADDALLQPLFRAVKIDDEGVPTLDTAMFEQELESRRAEALRNAGEAHVAKYYNPVDAIIGDRLPDFADRVNKRFAKVRLVPKTVVKGRTHYQSDGVQVAMDKLRSSPVSRLALGDQVEDTVAWLRSGLKEEAV